MEGDFPDGYLTANPPTPPFFKGGINWYRTYDFVHLAQLAQSLRKTIDIQWVRVKSWHYNCCSIAGGMRMRLGSTRPSRSRRIFCGFSGRTMLRSLMRSPVVVGSTISPL